VEGQEEMSFSFVLANQEDVPSMGKLFGLAFASDSHTQVKLLAKPMSEMVNEMNAALTSWLDKPERCLVIKAVEKSTNRIVGWVCWAHHGAENTVSAASQVEEREQVDGSEASNPSENQQSDSNNNNTEEEKDSLRQMERQTDGDMERWMQKIMPIGTRCMILACLVVDPAFQSRGIGSALIQKGIERADKEGIFSWVHASEAGHYAFSKEGFQVKETFELDLDEYAPLPREEDESWGTYTFRYMIRTPRISQ